MNKNLSLTESITIQASPAQVWQALVDPEIIKQYMFGTTVHTDWKVGSPITYTGEWQGKQYEDHGKILKIEKEKILQSTYWSSMGGTEDKPENYVTVTFELTPESDATTLSVTQEHIDSEDSQKHSGENWKMVLETIKKILEK